MERAHRTLELGRRALEGGFHDQVPNRAYYAAFYAATALLETRGIRASRHSAVVRLFGREFVVTGAIEPKQGRRLSALFEQRQQADYVPSPLTNDNDAARALTDAEALVSAASALLDEILAKD